MTGGRLDRLPGWKTLTRWAAWACIAAIAPLSLTPAEAVVRTGLGGHVEHAAAYAGTTFLVAAAYGVRARIVAGMLAYAAGLEFLQHFSPGRTPSLMDYTFSGMGIMTGIAAAILLQRCLVAPERASSPAQSLPAWQGSLESERLSPASASTVHSPVQS
jgi:hypothetical protein